MDKYQIEYCKREKYSLGLTFAGFAASAKLSLSENLPFYSTTNLHKYVELDQN
jgi:hypothetical protein